MLTFVAKLIMWPVTAFFLLSALLYFPAVAGFICFVIALLLLPLGRWQELIKGVLPKKWVKALLVFALFIGAVFTVPASDAEAEQPPVETPSTITLKSLSYSQDDPAEYEEMAQEIILSTFEIHFLDVGQGDAMLVLCDGKSMLIDGGEADKSDLIYSYLKNYNIEKLDYVVCTHAHDDHVGGLAGALNYATADVVYAPVKEYDSSVFKSFLKCLDRQGVEITVPSAGDSFMLGSAEVQILGPVKEAAAVNNSSIVLRIVYGETSFMLTADAEALEEADIIEAGYFLESTLLKVGHHGSNTSTSPEFLAAVKPSYAVISDGVLKSGTRRLTEETLNKLSEANVEVYRTDLHGHIICLSNGHELSFLVKKNNNADTLSLSFTIPSSLTADAEPSPTVSPEASPEATAAPTPSPTPIPSVIEEDFIINKNSKKFHEPSCPSVDNMKESNKQDFFGSRDELIAMGYDPCGNCHP